MKLARPGLRHAVAAFAFAFIALVAASSPARPGGGQSFSGRSGSSSSSSSGGSRSYGGSTSSSSSSGGSRSYGGSTSSSSSSSGGSRSSTSSSGGSGSSSSSSSSSSSGGGYGSSPSYSSPSYSSPSYSSPSYSSPAGESRSFGRTLLVFVLIALLVIGAIVLWNRRSERERLAWVARMDAEQEEQRERVMRYSSIEKALVAIRSEDDAFSYVLFEDFLYALYAETHTARGAKDGLARLAPYLSAPSRATYDNLPARPIDAVVVGGMRVEQITLHGLGLQVEVVFTSNVGESGATKEAFYMEERWTLWRSACARSRAPERARIIGCPSCGAPLDKTIGGKCGYCGEIPRAGEADWTVVAIEVLHREARGPMLTGTTEEVGTDLPTVVAPNVREALDALRASDSAFGWPAFVGRVERAFAAFHASWNAQDLTAVRPFLSDSLYGLQRYWVEAYRGQGLRNQTKDARLVTVHLARISRDKFFDAITVRVFASCFDYTVAKDGKIVGGKPDEVREYTEYWTFIRGVGKKGAPRDGTGCPSCGASLDGVNMAGTCTHCNAKITSGEFDWVLSRIEQDEVYERAA